MQQTGTVIARKVEIQMVHHNKKEKRERRQKEGINTWMMMIQAVMRSSRMITSEWSWGIIII